MSASSTGCTPYKTSIRDSVSLLPREALAGDAGVDFVDGNLQPANLVGGDIVNANAEEESMGAAFARLIKGALDCILGQAENP